MKKIVLILIPFTMSLAAIAQTNTKDTQTKKVAKQRTETKVEKVALLDGKSFKILLTQKDEAMSATPQNSTDADRKTDVNKNMGNNTTNPQNTNQTKEPVENPDLRQNQNGYADWSNAKGKIQFDNGMLKLSLNNKEVATDNCAYSVTSGTADLATFSASCKLNATTASSSTPIRDANSPQSGIGTGNQNSSMDNKISPSNPDNTAVENSGNMENNTGDVATQETVHPDDRTTVTKQPDRTKADQSATNTASHTSKQNEMGSQNNEMKSQIGIARVNINGFVNGSSISGSIVVYDNGKTSTFSFTGSTTGKRDAEPLGLNK